MKFKVSLIVLNQFKESMVFYENNKRKLLASSASDLTYFLQKCNLNCYLKLHRNGFRQDNLKKILHTGEVSLLVVMLDVVKQKA